MNVSALMDAIVRQTTVLLAQLATAGNGRAGLAQTNQVFLNLVEELKQQGLSSKVIADMFGLALRTYQERVRRLSESRTVRGRSLWEAVLEHIEMRGPVSRAWGLREVLWPYRQRQPPGRCTERCGARERHDALRH